MSIKVENLINLDRLTQYDGLIKNKIKEHSDIQASDTVSGHVKVDTGLSDTSTNPVQNKAVKNALDSKVPITRTVNGKALSSNISLSASDVGADPSGSSTSALSSAKSYTDTQISAVNSTLTSHTGNISNPHSVTKAQVGLEYANNTADKDKYVKGILDYADTSRSIQIGYSGASLTIDEATYIAAYTENGHKIKDLSFENLKTKLGLNGAEPNQNAFSNIVVESTTIEADSKTDTLTLVAGSNVILTPDATNDKITISSTNTDTKVTQTAVTASEYTNWRPLIWGASNSGTEGFTPTTVTDGTFTTNTISCQPSSGTIRASVFKGNLSGNATTASKWATARTLSLTGAVTGSGTFDGSGDLTITTVVNHTHSYAGSSSVGGAANVALGLSPYNISNIDELNSFSSDNLIMKYAKASNCDIGWGSKDGLIISLPWSSTYEAQIAIDDQSNWMGIRTKNSGTWNSWSVLLSSTNYTSYCTPANIGAAPASHTHSYLPLSGGTMTGVTNYGNGSHSNIMLRTDANWKGGIGWDNQGNEALSLWAINSATSLRWYAGKDMSSMTSGTMMGITPDFEISKADGTAKGYIGGTQISVNGHTHNYAGSSSAGGSATSAVKLDSSAGSATQPVYFSEGKPVACTYTLEKSVPSDAKFTDTVYTHPTSAGNKHIPSGGSSGQILGYSADGTAVWTNTVRNLVVLGSLSVNRKADTNIGTRSIAIGEDASATEMGAIAIGRDSSATGLDAIAIGRDTTATGGFCIGTHSETHGSYSFAAGNYTIANQSQFSIGHYNSASSSSNSYGTIGTAFVIGNGTSSDSTSNACRITYEGAVIGKAAYQSTGADFAELREWSDGNPNNEDRRGYFVTMDGMNIRIASPSDYICGIISANPSVIGNNDEDWMGRYVFDDFGAFVYEDYEETDPETGEVRTFTRYKENPEYDPTREYEFRADRPEWDYVGLCGVIHVRDDGTCQQNGFCKCAAGGIATASERGYRVLERVNDHIVKVLFYLTGEIF